MFCIKISFFGAGAGRSLAFLGGAGAEEKWLGFATLVLVSFISFEKISSLALQEVMQQLFKKCEKIFTRYCICLLLTCGKLN